MHLTLRDGQKNRTVPYKEGPVTAHINRDKPNPGIR